jgi:multiple sugar transport system permease protein
MQMSSTTGLLRKKRRSPGWIFVAPYVVSLLLFGLVPVIYAIVVSFQVTPIVGASYYSLTKNFSDVLGDYRLPAASMHVGTYLLIWLPVMLVVVFALALVMDAKRTKFAAMVRFVTYVPGAVTGSAAAVLWLFMFSPSLSPIGPFLKQFAGSDGTILSNQSLALLVAILSLSIGSGGWIVLLVGALSAIPEDLIEAAILDGANAWQLVTQIKLPRIKSYIGFILIVSFAGGFQVFAEPLVLTAGAPNKISSVWSLNQLVFSYVSNDANYGKASALALMLLVICAGVAVVVLTRTRVYTVEKKR